MSNLSKKQFFAGNLMMVSAVLEQIAYVAATEGLSAIVIEQLKSMRLILDEMVACGEDINPERITDILTDARQKLVEAAK